MFPADNERLTATRMREYMQRGAVVGLWERTEPMTMQPASDPVDGTPIAWDTTLIDELGAMHPQDRSIIRPTLPGWYLLAGAIGFEGESTGGSRAVTWWKSNLQSSVAAQSTNRIATTSFGNFPISVEARSWPVEFDGEADAFQLRATHNASNGIAMSLGGIRSYISLIYLRPLDESTRNRS